MFSTGIYANASNNSITATSFIGTATVATRLLTNNTSQNGDDCYDGIPGLQFYRYNGTSSSTGQSGGDGWIMQWSWNRGSVGQQLYLDDNPSGVMLIRGCNGSDGTTGKPNKDPKFTSWWRLFTDAYHPTADKWTTARTLTIGNTGKSVDGSSNVSWSLSEIGAAALSHTHDYLYST
jgi:hypothetical protein